MPSQIATLFLLELIAVSILIPVPNLRAQSKDAPSTSSGQASKPTQAGPALVLLSDTEGVDFNSYLAALYRATRDKWKLGMPLSVERGNQGVNIVQFRVNKDGSVPEEFFKLISPSGKKDLDEASVQAVHKAAPFSHLPDKFSQSFIILRMTFYYNLAVPKSQ